MSKGGIWHILGLSTPFDADHGLVASPAVSPLTLAVIRLTFALYTLVDFIVNIVWTSVNVSPLADNSSKAAGLFSYFTELSYIGLIAYFWASGVQTIIFALSRSARYPLQRWPRSLQFLHMLLYSTVSTYPILVTIIYWAVPSDSETFSTVFSSWSSISEHALNSAVALFEILMTHVSPMPWIHILFLDLILAGYLGIAYITHITQSFYPYDFLDPKTEGSLLAAYIVGIGAGEIVLFIVVRYICVLREWLSRRWQRTSESSPAESEALDEWEEITQSHVI